MMKNIFSIDVEDWFHILDLKSSPRISDWSKLPIRVERNFHALLELLEKNQIKATCFFLGWVAEQFPELVKTADRAGHEIASHGYGHQLVYTMSEEEFRADLTKSKLICESITGKPLLGYRAPGFSFTEASPWAFQVLSDLGFQYDSSVFPASRAHGGMASSQVDPYLVHTPHGSIIEFPISVTPVFGKRVCFFGGGYFRLFPYGLVRKMIQKVNAEDRPVIFYIHPREVDALHPRLQMGVVRRFKSYVNLKSTEAKMQKMLDDFQFTSFKTYIDENFTASIQSKESA